MKLALSLTILVLILGAVAFGSFAVAGIARGVPGGAEPAVVVFAAGVGVLTLTAGFLALQIPLVLRRG